MNNTIIPFGDDGILKEPGDKISAEKMPSGLEVLKVNTAEIKETAVRYPSTGTIVETKVIETNKQLQVYFG